MKAIVQESYGNPEDVLHMRDIPKPAPGPNEVLVQVHAASVSADVWHAVTGYPYILRLFFLGMRKPKSPVPGLDIAGIVEAVGSEVTRFVPGDAVFGETAPRLAMGNFGAYAEYALAPEEQLAIKPDSISFVEAAALPNAFGIALGNITSARHLKPPFRVLINGAGGHIGCLAIQLFKNQGASVTAVDRADKLQALSVLGADHVIDYTQEDISLHGTDYDFILDIASTLRVREWKSLLKASGLYTRLGHDHYGSRGKFLGSSIAGLLPLLLRAPFDRQIPSLEFSALPSKKHCIQTLQNLLAEGKLKPTVADVFPLSAAAAALRHLAGGSAKGTIVIAVGATHD